MDELFNRVRGESGIPSEIDLSGCDTVLDVFAESVEKYADCPAFTCFGHTLSFADVDRLSAEFAAYLQNHTSLKPGNRIALQMPNILQYPVVLFGVLRAGLIVVNTNPLYTEREMEHQFNDSGALALVVVANMAHLAEKVVPKTSIKYVIVTELADLLPPLKRVALNLAVKYVKKMVPRYALPQAVTLNKALQLGRQHKLVPVNVAAQDVAVLQYTGGTTGVAKGAMLTQRNLVSNMLQARPIIAKTKGLPQRATLIAPLPMYHIYALTVHCMVAFSAGYHTVLVPNPRDITGFVKLLQQTKFDIFVGLNTLFVALMSNAEFQAIDFSRLKLTLSGGMALTFDAANRWKQLTGCDVYEGYGMTETSPIVSLNPYGLSKLGTVGIPVGSTSVKVINEQGEALSIGEAGEVCVKGPQVMKGYWQRPEATAEVMIDGWLRTGDMAVIQEDGYIRLVDRKKDMVIVSGFNVYPNEIENVLCEHSKIIECAVIGVPDEKSGEAVKAFVVTNDPALTADEVRDFCRDKMTAYKVPRFVEFRTELPKSNVGKVLRRELRDQAVASSK